jgi:hypothetical protein
MHRSLKQRPPARGDTSIAVVHHDNQVEGD